MHAVSLTSDRILISRAGGEGAGDPVAAEVADARPGERPETAEIQVMVDADRRYAHP